MEKITAQYDEGFKDGLREVGKWLEVYFVAPSSYLQSVINLLKDGNMPEAIK